MGRDGYDTTGTKGLVLEKDGRDGYDTTGTKGPVDGKRGRYDTTDIPQPAPTEDTPQ